MMPQKINLSLFGSKVHKAIMMSRGLSGFLKLKGQVVMRCLLFYQKVGGGGQLPLLPPPFTYAPEVIFWNNFKDNYGDNVRDNFEVIFEDNIGDNFVDNL